MKRRTCSTKINGKTHESWAKTKPGIGGDFRKHTCKPCIRKAGRTK